MKHTTVQRSIIAALVALTTACTPTTPIKSSTNSATNNATNSVKKSETAGVTNSVTPVKTKKVKRIQDLVSGAEWVERCPEIKRRLAGSPGAEHLFTLLPRPKKHAPAWLLKWEGINIAIPAAPYKELALGSIPAPKGQKERTRVLLVTSGGTVITTVLHGRAAMMKQKDVFAMSDAKSKKPQITSVGEEATTRLFGGPISSNELYRRAFQSTPKDLTCKADNWKKEASIAYALIIGALGAPTMQSIHDGVGPRKGWLKHVLSDANGSKINSWEAFIEHDDMMMGVLVADRLAPEAYALGALIGKEFKEEPSLARPGWLNALQAYQDKPTKRHVKKLRAEMKKAKLSARGIKSLDNLKPKK